MKSTTVPPFSKQVLLSVIAAMAVLVGCADRQPMDPVHASALPSTSPEPLGIGTAIVDGVMDREEWEEARRTRLTVGLPNGESRKAATLYVMNDAVNIYFAIRYDDNVPVPGPNSVARLVFEMEEGCDELAIENRVPKDRFRQNCEEFGSDDEQQHGAAKRGNRVYEFSKPLCSEDHDDVCVHAGDTLRYFLLLEPVSGQGARTRNPDLEFDGFVIRNAGVVQPLPPPNFNVLVIDPRQNVALLRCDNTVKVKNADNDDFLLLRASPTDVPGECLASFRLTPGGRFIVSVRNEVISSVEEQDIWPVNNGVATDPTLPEREGAIFIHSAGESDPFDTGASTRLTQEHYYTARERSKALPDGVHTLTLFFEPGGRTLDCRLDGATYPAFVYAMLPLDRSRGGIFNVTPDPALGVWANEVVGENTPCKVKIPAGLDVVLEAQDPDGTVYRSLVGSNDPSGGTVIMGADPKLEGVSHIVDPWDDNPGGKDDLGLGIVGLDEAGNLVIKFDVRKIQERGTAQLRFALSRLNGQPGSIEVMALCSKQHNRCWIAEMNSTTALVMNPAPFVDGRINSNGDGWVLLRIHDFVNITSADIRVRAGVANGYDFAPDLAPFVWSRGNGNSWKVAF
jgi:hypothetical protein